MTTIPEAVATVMQYVRDTRKPVAEAVRAMWGEIGDFSEEDTKTLLQEAMAARVGPILNDPLRIVGFQTGGQHSPIHVTVQLPAGQSRQQPLERHEVTCQLLHDATYFTNGVMKPIISFTLVDVGDTIERLGKTQAGIGRHLEFFTKLKEDLVRFKKTKVEDLGEGTLNKFARAFYDIKHKTNPKDLIPSTALGLK